MNLTKLREHAENYGVMETAVKAANLIREEKLPTAGFSIRKLWEAFIGPVDHTLPRALKGAGLRGNPLIEEVRSSAFTIVTQAFILNKVLDAYTLVPGVIDELVSPFPSNLRTEKVTGFTAVDGPLDVPEGEEYPATGLADRATEGPEPAKRGRAIEFTAEVIKFDQTGKILGQAAQLGRKMAVDRDKRGIQTIEDATASQYAFYPIVAGVPTRTAIFRTSAVSAEWYNKTVNQVNSNALVDWTDIEAAWLLWKDMTDEAGDKITIAPTHLLIPMNLVATAHFIINATQTRKATASAVNIALASNVTDAIASGLKIVTSPHMGSTSTWFLGDFKSQYYEQVIFPTEVIDVPGNPRKDIVQGMVVRSKSRVYAADDKFVIRSQSGA